MLPAIAEVVEVFERPGADIFQHVGEAGLAGIERPVAEVRIGPAPADVTCTDLAEMAVHPAHSCLQHKVQTIQADRERYLDPAHDSRFDIIKLDPHLIGGAKAAPAAVGGKSFGLGQP